MITDKWNLLRKKAYKFFVVKDGVIESGWEYREDANDHRKENGGKVYSRSAAAKLASGKSIGGNSATFIF